MTTRRTRRPKVAPEQRQAPEAETSMKRTSGVRPAVLKILEQTVGTTVYIDDIVGTHGFHRSSVQAAMRELVAASMPHGSVETVVTGQAWQWRPKKGSGKRLFEELAVAKDGTIFIQDDEGNVYKATEV